MRRAFLRDASAATAVEFALIAPVLLAMLFGFITFGYTFSVYHSVQQLASEAARAAVAGISDTERDTIARAFVAAHAPDYVLIDPARISVATEAGTAASQTFKVSIGYDLSASLVYALPSFVPLPDPRVTRSAVILRGGY